MLIKGCTPDKADYEPRVLKFDYFHPAQLLSMMGDAIKSEVDTRT